MDIQEPSFLCVRSFSLLFKIGKSWQRQPCRVNLVAVLKMYITHSSNVLKLSPQLMKRNPYLEQAVISDSLKVKRPLCPTAEISSA